MKGIEIVEIILAVLIIISPWLFPDVITVTNVAFGVVLIILSIVELSQSKKVPEVKRAVEEIVKKEEPAEEEPVEEKPEEAASEEPEKKEEETSSVE